MKHHTVGIDISKARLDAFAYPSERAARFSNDRAGFRKLIAWIGPRIDRIAYEPTGPWHRDFEDVLLEAGLPLYAINPYHVRCFARSQGRQAKTDATDARTLAAMAEAIDGLRPTAARSQEDRDLCELQLVRDALVRDRKAIANRGRHLRHPLSRQLNRRQLDQIKRQLKQVEAEIEKLLRSDEARERRLEILTSIPGISTVTASALLVRLPELGTMTGPRAASLAGLAPVTRESGTWRGRSFIQGGRGSARRTLYMPAVTAIRHNPDLKRQYERMRAAGKPAKVAITAAMRKLVVLANVLLQQDRCWTPEPPAPTA